MNEIFLDHFIFNSPSAEDISTKDQYLEFYGWSNDGEIIHSAENGPACSFECISKQWFDEHKEALPKEGWSDLSDFAEYHKQSKVARLIVEYKSSKYFSLDVIKNEGLVNRWVVISLKISKSEPREIDKARVLVYSTLEDTGRVYALNQIDLVENTVEQLNKSIDCSKIIQEASQAKLVDFFSGINPICKIIVYDVGQGSAVGIFSSDSLKAIIFDFGAGVYRDAHTYPHGRPQIPYSRDSIIVLSHWHEDHWAGIRFHPDALNLTWLLPQNPTRHVQSKLLAQIALNDGKLFYCSGYESLTHTSGFRLKMCKGSGPNNSGLAAFVKITKESKDCNVLLPGDCAYSKLDETLLEGISLDTVVATHHGGKLGDDIVPQPAKNQIAKVIFSAGFNNSYGHPLVTTIQEYLRKGWPKSGFQFTACRISSAANDITLP